MRGLQRGIRALASALLDPLVALGGGQERGQDRGGRSPMTNVLAWVDRVR